jgi:hypothetical protein
MSSKQPSFTAKIGENIEIDLLKRIIKIHKETKSTEDELVLGFSDVLEKS